MKMLRKFKASDLKWAVFIAVPCGTGTLLSALTGSPIWLGLGLAAAIYMMVDGHKRI